MQNTSWQKSRAGAATRQPPLYHRFYYFVKCFLKNHRESFDIVTARAVASLNILAEICVPFVKINGVFIALKGASYQEEIDSAGLAFNKLKAKYSLKHVFELPKNMGERAIILYKKIENTPNIYPRIYAKIKKNPL